MDALKSVANAIEDVTRDAPREKIYDGDDEIRCVMYVPPWNQAVKYKCRNCGKIVYENQLTKDKCVRCE